MNALLALTLLACSSEPEPPPPAPTAACGASLLSKWLSEDGAALDLDAQRRATGPSPEGPSAAALVEAAAAAGVELQSPMVPWEHALAPDRLVPLQPPAWVLVRELKDHEARVLECGRDAERWVPQRALLPGLRVAIEPQPLQVVEAHLRSAAFREGLQARLTMNLPDADVGALMAAAEAEPGWRGLAALDAVARAAASNGQPPDPQAAYTSALAQARSGEVDERGSWFALPQPDAAPPLLRGVQVLRKP